MQPVPELEGRFGDFLDMLDTMEGCVHGHSMAVCELAVRTARTMGVGARELPHVAAGALMHDIGKVFIDGRVLSKPAALSPAEWETIRLHPVLGEALLTSGPFQEAVLAIVRSHHERWDGSGYPDGLDGRSIPLGARIVAAADAFRAMCESRPYRRALSPGEAAQELERSAWAQFDGSCVRALVDSLS